MTPRYYSWVDGFSTDPEWSSRKGCRLLCDGVVVEHVFRCMTGPDGFVEHAVHDSSGKMRYHNQVPVTRCRVGNVEVEVLS